MDSINKIINFLFPLLTLYALLVFYPTYQRLKSAVSICRNLFSENVAGKVVVITGAASGIGEALAYEYGKRGAYLALVDIRGEPLFHVAALAELYGSPEVLPLVADVSKLQDCERFIRATVLHFGRLDHLVTNAGVAPLYFFADIEDVSKASPAMASKAAVIAFYETLRTEFGSDIGVTIVAPGIVDSEMSRGKFMTKDGKLVVDKELRDVQMSVLPVESAERCAKAIMRSVCRGDRYLLEPDWIGCVILLKVFCSEATEWVARWLLIARPKFPMMEALSNKILDVAHAFNSFFSFPHY